MRAIRQLRRQHILRVHKDFGRYLERWVLILAAKDSFMPLDKAPILLLDLGFSELGDLHFYPGLLII